MFDGKRTISCFILCSFYGVAVVLFVSFFLVVGCLFGFSFYNEKVVFLHEYNVCVIFYFYLYIMQCLSS